MLRKIILAILSGLLSGLAFTAAPRANLIFIALVPLFYVVAKEKARSKLILYSCLAGLSHAIFSVAWIRHVAFVALPALALYISLFWIAFSLFSNWAMKKKFNYILIPAMWVILEWIKLSYGFFGWNLFSYALANRLYLVQTADLWGPWGISFLVIWSNLIIYDLIFANKKLAVKQLFALLLFVFLSYSYGYWRIESVKKDLQNIDFIKTQVIQPNASKDDKESFSGQVKLFDGLKDLLEKTNEDSLILSAEATWPSVVRYQDFKDIALFLGQYNRDILLGVVEERENGSFNNSMLFYDRESKLIDRYAKIKLVPFGEFVPLRRFLKFIDALNMLGDMQAGSNRTIFDYKGNKFAALICFEDIFTGLTSAFVRDGAQFLVNSTDDSWFLGYPQVYQHALVARFRAIENKRSLVRAANSGISCLIEPWGELNQILEKKGEYLNFSAVGDVNLKPYGKMTFFSKYPNFFIVVLFLAMISIFMINRKEDYGIKNSRVQKP